LKSSPCLSVVAILCAASGFAAPPSVRVLEEPTRIEVSAELPAPGVANETFLRVALLDDATGQAGAPVFGAYSVHEGRLVFRPRFALAPGARYRISAGSEHLDHAVPAQARAAAAVVSSVSPGAGEVPANLLKFYLYFSRPMREGREVFERIHLLDENGRAIPGTWRDTELWTEDARRLTLWIHPGRVKRGVNLREDLGPVLRPGKRYTLLVEAGLRDATGQPLAREHRHSFQTIAESHARLDPSTWKVETPSAGTREALHIVATVPLDAVIGRRSIHVQKSSGGAVPGVTAPADDGRTWTFTPRDPWASTSHDFVVDPWLEDLAGNTVARVFDDDLTALEPAERPSAKRTFTPR
jgi:hypothetical protein